MKKQELKKCGICNKGVMHNGSFIFYKISLQRFIINAKAVQRQHGLEMMLGSPALANILGPDEDIAKPLSEKATALICDSCAMEQNMLAVIDERIRDE